MNNYFPRIITLLRKERGLSQKQVALDLNVSQALLSHYEKGIRECGLDFLVSVAEYYNVSCDYLLGRTPDRKGATLNINDILPDSQDNVEMFENNNVTDINNNRVNQLNKTLITNSINIIYDILDKAKSQPLSDEVSTYIMAAVYKMFRSLYSGNPKNLQGIFSINSELYKSLMGALECISSGKVDINVKNIVNSDKDNNLLITQEQLTKEYPAFASSLYNLIQKAENKMNNFNK